jgi:uncharacterized protein YegJ (DUF2314 family)
MRIGGVPIAVLALVCAGCGDSDGSEPPVTAFKDDDKQMNAAMERARQTLDEFITQLQKPKESQTYFSVKGRFEEEGKVEHIWLSDVRFDGTQFTGKLGNTPKHFKRIALGSPCTVPMARVSDWMIIEDGRLLGGTTIRVARSRKTGEEREKFDRMFPFKMD